MSYDPALLTVVDKVRFSLLDTDAAREWLPDETYEALLVAGGASTTEVDAATASVARMAARAIAAAVRHRGRRRTNNNGETLDYADLAVFYDAIADGETALPLLEVDETPAPTPNITALLGSRSVSTEARF